MHRSDISSSRAGSHRKALDQRTRQQQHRTATAPAASVNMCSRNIKISVVLFLVLIPIFTALPHNHNLSKRSNFFDLECKGIFNKTMFFRLDRICEDCYQLFRETSIHRLCKKDCFDSKWFGECLKVLLIPEEEVSNLQHFLRVVNGSPISFNMTPGQT
ncbi:GL10219 [Drosophila persimilis]|uniref:Ion transport peptide-like isoform X1 n=2 Tax=pseudoobscura subgroup TaxID=32358 RepID=A0A6I8VG94_DROPS|nr:ion transport peptide-like isoform X1 [Drosophila persimilis]XP_015040660.1 ion transport peptide-like isoform X1 [Drosophila pseudoobscura]EDW32890.1 GL10219 [Drosophila persimilis]